MTRNGMLAVTAALVVAWGASSAHDEKEKTDAAIHTPDGLRWGDGPPSLPPGAMVAVLEGDPTRPGPFVMRLRLPDGYRLPPHTHPKRERVTVVSGTFHVGMGDKFDEKAGRAMRAG